MNLFDRILNGFDNLFVPRDGLYDQARDVIAQFNDEDSGVVSLGSASGASPTDAAMAARFGIAANLFAEADAAGNGNGYVTAKEVRRVLKQYDAGSEQDPSGGPDGAIQGVEWLTMLIDLSMRAYANTGVGQADEGAEHVGNDDEPPGLSEQRAGGYVS